MITSDIQLGMIRHFDIEEGCMESRPCVHSCTITLSDGRTKKTNLNGVEIFVLINAIAAGKILCNGPSSNKIEDNANEIEDNAIQTSAAFHHFYKYETYNGLAGTELGRLFPDLITPYVRPIPSDILSKIFNNKH